MMTQSLTRRFNDKISWLVVTKNNKKIVNVTVCKTVFFFAGQRENIYICQHCAVSMTSASKRKPIR